MLLPVLIVIKQHSLISLETKVCLLGSPSTCDNFFSIRQRYRDSPRPKTWTSWLKNLVQICLYCLNCTKFGQLILSKIIEIVATRWIWGEGRGRERKGRGKMRGSGGARKVVCPGARAGSRRACMYLSIFISFRVIRCLSQCVSPKIAIFTTFLFPLKTPLGQSR